MADIYAKKPAEEAAAKRGSLEPALKALISYFFLILSVRKVW